MVRKLAPLALVAIALLGAAPTRYRAGINSTVANHLEYAAQAARDGRGGEAGGYAKALLIGQEITYAIAMDPQSEPQRATAMQALETAAKTWRGVLDDSVTIRAARDGETPNLVVHFDPDVRVDDRAVSGYIRWRREVRRTGNGWEGIFEGQIFARTQYKGKAMTVEAMRCCLGHELGHMFGLPDATGKDDSGNEAIMGPLNLARPVLSPNRTEIETVQHIREDATEIERIAGAGSQNQMILELDGSERHTPSHRSH